MSEQAIPCKNCGRPLVIVRVVGAPGATVQGPFCSARCGEERRARDAAAAALVVDVSTQIGVRRALGLCVLCGKRRANWACAGCLVRTGEAVAGFLRKLLGR